MGFIFGQPEAAPAPQAPIIQPPTVMPTPDDKKVKDAKRRSLAMRNRGGRADSILSQNDSNDPLGA
jgi:hypothetical protein